MQNLPYYKPKPHHMMAVQKILFPTDFSDQAQNAFSHCLVIADKLGASIEIAHVVYPEYEGLDFPVMSAQNTQNKVAVVRSLVDQFMEHGYHQTAEQYTFKDRPKMKVDVEVGVPMSTIPHLATRDKIDLIVMGTKAGHPLLERLFNSVTTATIQHAPCPVWVVPEQAPYHDITRIGYATDLHEADPYHIWQVGKLLEPFDPTLHCFHVNTSNTVEEIQAFNQLATFFEDHAPALKIEFHPIPQQDITEGLMAFSEVYDLDVLIMYQHDHSLIERLFKQSQTRKMAFHTKIPLLVLKGK